MKGRIQTWPDTKDERPNPLPEHTWIEFSLSSDLLELIYNNIEGNNFETLARNPTNLAGKQALELYKAVTLQALNGQRRGASHHPAKLT